MCSKKLKQCIDLQHAFEYHKPISPIIQNKIHGDTFFERFYLFLQREEGREKKRERNITVWLPLTCPLLGTWSATQACALTGNQTNDPLVSRPELNLLSHTSHGHFIKAFATVFPNKQCSCFYNSKTSNFLQIWDTNS